MKTRDEIVHAFYEIIKGCDPAFIMAVSADFLSCTVVHFTNTVTNEENEFVNERHLDMAYDKISECIKGIVEDIMSEGGWK